MAEALAPIGDAFELLSNLLKSLALEMPGDPVVAAAAELCAESERLSPRNLVSITDEPFLEFVSAFTRRVRELQPGQVLLTPGCMDARSGTLFVLGKRDGDYVLAVCSTGA